MRRPSRDDPAGRRDGHGRIADAAFAASRMLAHRSVLAVLPMAVGPAATTG